MTPWHCGRCDRSGEVADEVAVIFHRCVERRDDPTTWQRSTYRTTEERRSASWKQLFADLEDR